MEGGMPKLEEEPPAGRDRWGGIPDKGRQGFQSLLGRLDFTPSEVLVPSRVVRGGGGNGAGEGGSNEGGASPPLHGRIGRA